MNTDDADLEDELMDSKDNLSCYLPKNLNSKSHNVEPIQKAKSNFVVSAASKDGIVYHRRIVHELSSLYGAARNDLTLLHPIWKLLIVDIPTVESKFPAKLLDQRFQEDYSTTMEANHSTLLAQHFNLLFRTCPTAVARLKTIYHSLGNVVVTFAQTFHVLYRRKEQRADWDNAVADIKSFMSIMVQLVKFKYPFVIETDTVYECLEESVFRHCQPTLHCLLLSAFSSQDLHLSASIAKQNVEENHKDNNSSVLLLQEQFGYATTPAKKIALVTRVTHLIAADTQRSTDELIPILANVLVRATVLHRHLASYGALMTDFMPPSIENGEAGFAVTLYQSSLQHIIRNSIII